MLLYQSLIFGSKRGYKIRANILVPKDSKLFHFNQLP
jgi:hypothetical protein